MIKSSLFVALLYSSSLMAAEQAILMNMILELQHRVTRLEEQLKAPENSDRWKDPLIWNRIKKDMPDSEIKKLIGKPFRVEQQIFETWYYHPSSKLHSFIWFDEARVLGWKGPDPN